MTTGSFEASDKLAKIVKKIILTSALPENSDKFMVEAVKTMITMGCVPLILAQDSTWRCEHNITKADIVEMIQKTARTHF